MLEMQAGGRFAGMADAGDSSNRLAEFDAAYAKLRGEWETLDRELEPMKRKRLQLDRKIEPLERRRRELDRSFAQLLTAAGRSASDGGAGAAAPSSRRLRVVSTHPQGSAGKREKTAGPPSTASDNGTASPHIEASERVAAVMAAVAPDLPPSLESTFLAMLVLELDQGITGPLPREVALIRGADTTKGRAATHSYLKRLAKTPSPGLVEQLSTNPARFRLADSVREVANSR